jgi:hypothetical protein
MDTVPWTRSVMFVGDHFSLITTVELQEGQRKNGESDEDLAARIAGEFLLGFYGWNVAAASLNIGVVDAEDLG